MEENIISIRKRDLGLASAAFADFMSMTENCLNSRAEVSPKQYSRLSASELEQLSVDIMKEIAPSTPFRDTDIQLVSGHSFPDIMAGCYYGVEVKSTQSNYWTSTGSSIVESTRNKTVEDIYLLFGKLGGKPPEFKCRPYQNCLYDIAVTHSPRYLINMELSEEQTIFYKMGMSYDKLRTSEDTIGLVRKYYKQKAIKEDKKEMPWWLSDGDDGGTVNVNLRHYSTLSAEEKNYCICQCLILFPDVIHRSGPEKYINIALWLCTYNGVLISNVRDMFSAGGQAKFIDDKQLKEALPGIVIRIVNNAPVIKKMLSKPHIYDFLEPLKENNPNLLSYGLDRVFEVWARAVSSNVNTLLQNKGLSTVNVFDWIMNGQMLKK